MLGTDQEVDNRSANALVVYTPKAELPPSSPQERGIFGRALRYARAALMLWGGFSLAGVAAGGIVYAHGGFAAGPAQVQPVEMAKADIVTRPLSPEKAEGGAQDPTTRSAGTRQPSPAASAPEQPVTASKARPAIAAVARQEDGPKPYQPPTPRRKASVADADGGDATDTRPALAPAQAEAAAVSPVPAPTDPVAVAAGADGRVASAVPERVAVARLPQARPSEPAVTRSVRRQQHASNSQRRFRRLRDMPLPFRQQRRYHEPEYDHPALPPFFFYR